MVSLDRTDLPLDRTRAVALGVVAGFLYFIGFPGLHLWPISFVALAPLVIALEGQGAVTGLLVGAACGFTMNVAGFYWLYGSLRRFTGLAPAGSAALMIGVCFYQGLRIALFAWLYLRVRRLFRRREAPFLLAFAASELAFPVIMPWYLGASMHELPALMQAAEIGGPYLVSLVVACPSLGIAELALSWRRSRRPAFRSVVWMVIVPSVAAVAGALRLHQVDIAMADAEPVQVGIVQADLASAAGREARESRIARHLALTDSLRLQGADLVVWGESVVAEPVPSTEAETFLRALFSRPTQVPMVLGAFVVDATGPRLRGYNSALALDSAGQLIGRYDKEILFPFGEYIPFVDRVSAMHGMLPNASEYSVGSRHEFGSLNGHPLAALICYEAIFPDFVNGLVRWSKPELLLNLSNDVWFGDTTEPWIHLALSQFRAIEHRRFLVRAANTGVSAIVDAGGRVIRHTNPNETTTLLAGVRWMRGATAYEFLGNAPWWICFVFVAIIACMPSKGRLRRERAAG